MPKNTIILLEMTAQDWIRYADIPYNVKNGFTLLAGDIESYLSGRYNYKTGWDKNEDVTKKKVVLEFGRFRFERKR